jgi:hypothetical protein
MCASDDYESGANHDGRERAENGVIGVIFFALICGAIVAAAFVLVVMR